MIIYKVGDSAPSSTIADYYPPRTSYRVLDFDGYNHTEYPVKLKAIIYYFTQQNKSATAVIVVVVTNILI